MKSIETAKEETRADKYLKILEILSKIPEDRLERLMKDAFEYASNQMGLDFSNSNVVDNQGLFFDPYTDNTELDVIFGWF